MKTNTKSTIAFAALFCFVLAGVYVGAFLFMENAATDASRATLELAQAKDQNQNIDSVQTLLTNTASKRAALDGFFLTSDHIVDFKRSLFDWGHQTGITISLRNLSDMGGTMLSFDMDTTGTFNDQMRFLSLLENLPYNVKIDKVNFTESTNASSTKASTVMWNGNITGNLLSYIKVTQ